MTDFDPVLHSAPRITIMARMVVHRRMRFAALRRSTGLTPGNLASHLDVLTKAGYVELTTPERAVARQRIARITASGDAAYRDYVTKLRAFVAAAEADLHGTRQAGGQTVANTAPTVAQK